MSTDPLRHIVDQTAADFWSIMTNSPIVSTDRISWDSQHADPIADIAAMKERIVNQPYYYRPAMVWRGGDPHPDRGCCQADPDGRWHIHTGL